MTDLPLVSIVTPSFNQGAFLEETILSVLRQDYPNIEYIIIDGGSSDESADIISSYSSELAYWVSEKDEGQTHAILKGFSQAKGKYLGWLCSDDVLEPSMVSISVDFHSRGSNLACTFGDRIRIDAKGNIFSLDRYSDFRRWNLRCGLTLPQETTLFSREAFDAVGGLDQSLHMAMDFDLWCKFSKRFLIKHIPAVLGRFRSHEKNKSTQFTREAQSGGEYFAEYTQIIKRHFGRKFNATENSVAKKLRSLSALFNRRSRTYRRELHDAQSIRLTKQVDS